MAPLEVAMSRNATSVAKTTPGAIGNNETLSGEMTLFINYFSRSVLLRWVVVAEGMMMVY